MASNDTRTNGRMNKRENERLSSCKMPHVTGPADLTNSLPVNGWMECCGVFCNGMKLHWSGGAMAHDMTTLHGRNTYCTYTYVGGGGSEI